MTPITKPLPWLPVRQRIDFKALSLVVKPSNGASPIAPQSDFSEEKKFIFNILQCNFIYAPFTIVLFHGALQHGAPESSMGKVVSRLEETSGRFMTQGANPWGHAGKFNQ